ncbi:hypothetical protein B0J13DRAFT_638595 [Dactylonectria estremocensis]|uniref:Uncharacterized protein n=1 Tax=Dactylonectria estremocensis TaxID=1079267 RepID=A0A9P9IZI6_9HYPO|nr:hypothetical protein B0J13DRAFT_638595 [Dactylonectria estremocensis]
MHPSFLMQQKQSRDDPGETSAAFFVAPRGIRQRQNVRWSHGTELSQRACVDIGAGTMLHPHLRGSQSISDASTPSRDDVWKRQPQECQTKKPDLLSLYVFGKNMSLLLGRASSTQDSEIDAKYPSISKDPAICAGMYFPCFDTARLSWQRPSLLFRYQTNECSQIRVLPIGFFTTLPSVPFSSSSSMPLQQPV